MTKPFFLEQVQRLKAHFGDRAFSTEFVAIIRGILEELTDEELRQMVTSMIESRRHNAPPVGADFRESFHWLKKRQFDRNVAGAARQFFGPIGGDSTPERKRHLRELMQRLYRVDTVAEAIEIEEMKIRLTGGE